VEGQDDRADAALGVWVAEEVNVKRNYTVEVRSAPVADLTDTMLDAFSESLFEDRDVAGPAPSADLATHTLSVLTAVDARDHSAALAKALRAFKRALDRASADGEVSEAKVYVDRGDDRDELLSGGDIARRLGITRQRVHQLASRGRFPRPLVAFGTVTVWRWGDISDWASVQGRRVHRRKRAG
jgi:predicted DNA-binding transcriptional regulator AlpA